MIKEKIDCFVNEISENPNVVLDTNNTHYEILDDFILDMEIERGAEYDFIINKDNLELLSLSDLHFGWESTLKKVDTVLTGGFYFNSIVDALIMPSTFWKGAFSIPETTPPPPELEHFEKLGWFEHQPWEDGRRGCFIQTPGKIPPPIAFYSRGWYKILEMTFEEYFDNMLKMYGAKGWQFFFIELSNDIPYLNDVLEDMRIASEQLPLLFPDKDWEFLTKKYVSDKKIYGKE